VNAVQYSPSQQSRGKNKTKNKSKNINNNEQPKNQAQTLATKKKPQQKLKFPCIICGDDHYTRDCPRHNEVAKHFQVNSQLIFLTQPFPQQQSMVSQTPSPGGSSSHPHDEASTSAHIYKFNGINLTTLSKTYNTPGNPDKGKDTNGTSTLPDPSPSSVI
jgi:ribosomal protein L44E